MDYHIFRKLPSVMSQPANPGGSQQPLPKRKLKQLGTSTSGRKIFKCTKFSTTDSENEPRQNLSAKKKPCLDSLKVLRSIVTDKMNVKNPVKTSRQALKKPAFLQTTKSPSLSNLPSLSNFPRLPNSPSLPNSLGKGDKRDLPVLKQFDTQKENLNVEKQCSSNLVDQNVRKRSLERILLDENLGEQIIFYMKTVEMQNKTIIEQNKEIISKIDKLQSDNDQKNKKQLDISNRNLYEPLEGFPVLTIEDLEDLETDAKKAVRQKLYEHLTTIGALKLREFLNMSLKEIMIDDVLVLFTWKGTANTYAFNTLNICNIMYNAAKDCPLFQGPDNKDHFKNEMLEVLRAAKQRFKKRPVQQHPVDAQSGDDVGEEDHENDQDGDPEYGYNEDEDINNEGDENEDFYNRDDGNGDDERDD